MDAKALAKSKRAHSLHNSKKHHLNPKLKAPTSGASNDAARRSGNKPVALGKQAKEKGVAPAHHSALPSNWDRYEEEIDLDLEEDSLSGDGITSKAPDDVLLPKSKGADFRYLIDEARSQYQSSAYLDSGPSLEDVLPGDFRHLGPLLSVSGEGILSWVGDDNFVVEDETAANHEASFLSLNLHALAEQLAKVDMSERLFIEADLLPPELESKANDIQESYQMQTKESGATETLSEELALNNFNEKCKVVNQNTEVISLGSTANGYSGPILFSKGSDMLNQVKGNLKLGPDGKSDQSRSLESSAQFNASSVADPEKKVSTFEAAAAEAELDILLDSFNETMLPDSSGFTSGNFPVTPKESHIAMPQLTRDGPGSLKPTSVSANLDNVLDDLLEETSNSLKQNVLHQPWEVKSAPHKIQSSSSSQSVNKSKVLDDFDSWLDTI